MIPILLPPVTEDEVKENQLSHIVSPYLFFSLYNMKMEQSHRIISH